MIIDGKVYRNLEGQVAYLTEYLNANAVAAELGIKVVGQADNVSDIPEGEYGYGDAYMIGTEPPYTMYIWTRANGMHPEDYWFNVGQFPMPGPQGEIGLGIDDVISKTLGNWASITSVIDGNNATITMVGTESTTTSDNTTYTSPETVELPFSTDGQVKVENNNNTILIRLNENLPTTYVQQKVPTSAPTTGPHVYGANEAYSSKINYLAACPIRLTAYNVDMYRGNNTTYWADKYNTVLGKENIIGQSSRPSPAEPYACTENLVFGGKNQVNLAVQDSSTFGYRNIAGANQAFTAGYKNENYGTESIVIGNQNFLDGNTTVDTTPDPDTGGYDGRSSTTKHMAVFGNRNSIQHTNTDSLVAGYNNKVNTNSKWNFIIGANQNIGKYNACVNALDYGHTTGDYVEDSTVIGYGNHIYGGSSGNAIFAVNIFGNNCSNRSSSNNFKKVWMIGDGLVASRDEQIILGKYNATNPYDLLQVGDGTADDARSNLFTISNDPLDGPMITVGNVSLTAAQITALKALI